MKTVELSDTELLLLSELLVEYGIKMYGLHEFPLTKGLTSTLLDKLVVEE